MDELFGLSMDSLMFGILVALGIVALVLLVLALRSPLLFRMGLRNVPRRKAQTALIVFGLMLSTLIISSAFTTGDTLASSLRDSALRIAGPIDHLIQYDTDPGRSVSQRESVVPESVVDDLKAAFADDPQIVGFVRALFDNVSMFNRDTDQLLPLSFLLGLDPAEVDTVGGIPALDGGRLNLDVLGERGVILNQTAARELAAVPGHTIEITVRGMRQEFEVVAIAKDTLLSGEVNPIDSQGAVIPLDDAQAVFDQRGFVTGVGVTTVGSGLDALKIADEVDAKLNDFLQLRAAAEVEDATPFDQRVYADSQDRPIFVSDPFKADAVDDAETFGSIFTSFFLVMGLFSIGAGILLIFLIFVLLAEERKSEMGIARAIGMRRWHLVETYLAEGMAYNIGSAVVGAILGILVAFGMVAILNTLGDDFGFSLERHVEPRSVVVSAGLGILLVFITVIVSAYRVSSLNIVAAIRDIPESRLVQPRRFERLALYADLISLPLLLLTPVFLFSGALIAIVLAADRRADRLAFPVWARVTAMLLMLGVGPGLIVAILRLRTHLFDRPDLNTWLLFPQFKLMLRGQGLTSTIVGLVLLPTTIVTPLLGTIANLLPWLGTKIRRDGSAEWFVLPAWRLMRNKPEWWFSVLVFGVFFTQTGINGEVAFLYLLGLSLVPIGLLLFVRRLGRAGRRAHSLMGLAILVVWLAPFDVHEAIFGFDGDGDFELFFLSGAMMVTGGTVFLVFNLDALAQSLRRIGSVFGKLRPVVLTAAAYPTTARFRTGMAVAMIAIIMFALVTFTTINSNFSRLFTSETAAGGYAIQADANRNATFSDLNTAAIDEDRPDLADQLVDVSTLRLASFFGTDVVAIETEHWDKRAERRILDANGEAIEEPIEIELAESAFEESGDPIPGAADDPANFVYSTVLFTGADDALIDTNRILLQTRATGFDDDEAVWQALRTPLPDGSRYAIISAQAVAEAGGPFQPDEDVFRLPDTIEEESKRMPVVTVLVRDPSNTEMLTIHIIGVIDQVIGITGPTFSPIPSIVVADDAFAQLYDDPDLVRHFAKVTDGADAFAVAQGLEAVLRVETVSILDDLADLQDAQRTILGLFQGFTALGLFAGLAALGVIAVRAVVERRQQIGMLRAIGFSRGFVRAAMVLEMSFIALVGVALGTVLAVVLSWRLFTEGAFGSTSGAPFYVPIGQIVLFVVIAMAASVMLTYLPARQAARITIAEALRYE